MSYQEIVKRFEKIEEVEARGKEVYVNRELVATYKHKEVAKAVAEKVSYFKGV